MTAVNPLAEAPPALDPVDAGALLQFHWGIGGEVRPLKSERDYNVKVGSADGPGWVLKLQNPGDDPAVVDFQEKALAHVARVDPTLPVMRPVADRNGRTVVPVDLPDGRRTLARVFTWLAGHHTDGAALDTSAAHEWGATAARLGRALRGFFHPRADYEILWDIRHAPRLRAGLARIEDPAHHALVRTVLDRYDARVAPAIDRLRHQVIHGDLCLDNVLVDDGGRVSGIIDFGDMTHTALICDLAS